MKKLDLYIIKKFLGTFFFIISLFIVISIVFDISEKLDDFLERDAPFKAIVFEYYFSFIPWLYSILSSILIFLAVIFFTSLMASRNEIIAILSSGISFNRMLLPFGIAATILFLISVTLNNFVIPKTNAMKIGFEEKYYHYRGVGTHSDHFHRQIDDNTYIYIKSFNVHKAVGYKVALKKFENGELKSFLRASQIKWDTTSHKWQLDNYHIRFFENDGSERLVSGLKKDTLLNLIPKDLEFRESNTSALSYFKLKEYIEEEKRKGSTLVAFYEFEHYKRFAIPFSIFPLTLIAVSFSSRKLKKGLGINIFIGITLGCIYVFLGKVAEVFTIKAGIPAMWAIWTPNFIFAFIAFYAYKKTPK